MNINSDGPTHTTCHRATVNLQTFITAAAAALASRRAGLHGPYPPRLPACLRWPGPPCHARCVRARARVRCVLPGVVLPGAVRVRACRFAVIGSTGNHYVVSLSDGGVRKCQCMDHRVRKRDCKHIRLILGRLGIAADSSDDWRQVRARHPTHTP